MDYKKYIKEKLAEIFDEKLKSMEKKAISDLKEIEIIKYQLNDIYEGILKMQIIKIYIKILDNQDESIINDLMSKKLFYTYFDEERIIEYKIENTNNIFIEGLNKEILVKENSIKNTKNIKNSNLKNNSKTYNFI